MIYLGCDHGGFALKEQLKSYLQQQGYVVQDCGNLVNDPQDGFPTYVAPVVAGVRTDPVNVGILICGSGLGMSIAANHYVGIRAALVPNLDYAKLARQHNDANVLCLGGRFLTLAEAQAIVQTFLTTPLDPNPKYKQRMNQADGSVR